MLTQKIFKQHINQAKHIYREDPAYGSIKSNTKKKKKKGISKHAYFEFERIAMT